MSHFVEYSPSQGATNRTSSNMFHTDARLPSSTFTLFINILRTVGIWWPDEANTWYSMYSVLSVYMSIHVYTVGMALFCWRVRADLEHLIDAAFLLVTNMALVYKIVNWTSRFRRVQRLCQITINADSFLPRTAHETELVRAATLKAHRLYVFLVPGSFLGISLWMASPFFNQQAGERLQLPIPMWFFFECGTDVRFWGMFAYQFVGLYVSAVINLTIDAITAGLMLMARAQIEILGARLAAMGAIFAGDYEWNMSAVAELKRCTEFYRQTAAFVREVQVCFEGPLFVQLGCTSAMLCVTGYQMMSVGGGQSLGSD